MAEYVAALDGGGTKTLGAVADRSGKVQLLQSEPGCNPQDNPFWAANLRHAIAHFSEDGRELMHITLGLPGFGESPDHDTDARAIVAAEFRDNFTVLNDVELAYRAVFPNGGGVLLLAGTGSMCMAQGAGELIRVGGWGAAFGDEGSAYWVGRTALGAASQALDGRTEAQGFAKSLLNAMGIDQKEKPLALIAWIAGQDHERSAIASVSRIICDLAANGDRVAKDILLQAAGHLEKHVTAAVEKAALTGDLRWAHSGSLFRCRILKDSVTELLGASPLPARFDALGGGLWHAATAAGWNPDEQWALRVSRALEIQHSKRKQS